MALLGTGLSGHFLSSKILEPEGSQRWDKARQEHDIQEAPPHPFDMCHRHHRNIDDSFHDQGKSEVVGKAVTG